ncbi:hypothetical protein D3C73_1542100 [compost metagenome]
MLYAAGTNVGIGRDRAGIGARHYGGRAALEPYGIQLPREPGIVRRLAGKNRHLDAIITQRLDLPDCRQMRFGHEVSQAQQIDAELHCIPLTPGHRG